MQLYYIRHGQSANNARWDATFSEDGRHEDPELTDLGRAQAQAAASLLHQGNPDFACLRSPGGFGITHIYTSLMVRAVSTADIIDRALGLPLVAWPELHESGGIYLEEDEGGVRLGLPGNPHSFFEKRFPDLQLSADLDESGWWRCRPYEDRPQRLERARRVVAGLLERHGGSDDRVVFVSHAGFYNYIVTALMGLPDRPPFWFHTHNTAINRIDFLNPPEAELYGTEARLVYQNRIDHLSPELLTPD